MKRSGVVTSKGADIDQSVNWNEEMEFALIDECIENGEKGERVDGYAIGGDSDKKRDRLRKGGVEGSLGVQEVKRAKIRQGTGSRGGKNHRHTRREGWEGRGSSSSSSVNKELKLNSREKQKAVGGEIRDEVSG